MPTHIGFLRAVNIGKRPFKSADLRAALTEAGYGDVDTYIQTGNIRITSPLRSRAKIEAELEAVYLADRGFEVPTVVLSPAELTQVAADADDIAAGITFSDGHYVSLLKEAPSAAGRATVEGRTGNGEYFVVRHRAVHMMYDVAYQEAKQSNAQIEKVLGVATNRNVKVVRELAERWGSR
ncbi:MAG: DUF1697 domain-containing protein [Marmoricola sp.]